MSKYRSCSRIERLNLTFVGKPNNDGNYVATFCCKPLLPSVPHIDVCGGDGINGILSLRTSIINESKLLSLSCENEFESNEIRNHTAPCSPCPEFQNCEWNESNNLIYLINLSMAPAPCQCKCIYCWYPNDSENSPKAELPQKAYENVFSLLEDARNNGLIAPDVLWHVASGEITIHPFRERIFNLIASDSAEFLTNCFVFDEKIAGNLSANQNSRINLSIDAGTSDTWHSIKGFNNFNKVNQVLKKYSNICKNPSQITLKYIIILGVNDNIDDYNGVVKIMKELRVNSIKLSRDFNASRTENYQNESLDAAAEFYAVLVENGLNVEFEKNAFVPHEVHVVMDLTRKINEQNEMILKQISAFCIVKDDADVIESYCRYHLSFLDSIVIWDDNSSDSTQKIVEKLADEGLSVELIVIPKDEPFLRDFNINKLQKCALYVFEKYNADLVIPLDVDEFLYCEDGSNPRDTLEKLDEKAEHRFFWRTSVYSKDPDDDSIFLPNYFEEYRDPAFEIFPKTLLSKYIVEKCDGFLMAGKHGLGFHDEAMRNSVPIINNDLIRIAHFPIRSTSHAMIKTVCMQLRSSTFINAKPFQYKRIYDEIKFYGKPTKEQTRSFSLEYALNQEQLAHPVNTIKQFRGALKADFLKNDIRLAYTNYQSNNYLEQILSFFELLLEKLKMEINMNKDDAAEAKKLLAQTVNGANDLKDAKLRIQELEKTVLKTNDELQQARTHAEHLLNSTIWRMTKPLRVVMNFLRRKR